jgi:hypothetical protein
VKRPAPARVTQARGPSVHTSAARALKSLQGGDLRSVGAADTVAAQIVADPALVVSLVDALVKSEPVVRMRAADALEKASRRDPSLLAGHEAVILELLSSPQPKEVRWHLLQLASRIAWAAEDHSRLLRAILQCFADSSSIVKTEALQALFELGPQGAEFQRSLRSHLERALASGTPAMQARARKLQATAPARHSTRRAPVRRRRRIGPRIEVPIQETRDAAGTEAAPNTDAKR